MRAKFIDGVLTVEAVLAQTKSLGDRVVFWGSLLNLLAVNKNRKLLDHRRSVAWKKTVGSRTTDHRTLASGTEAKTKGLHIEDRIGREIYGHRPVRSSCRTGGLFQTEHISRDLFHLRDGIHQISGNVTHSLFFYYNKNNFLSKTVFLVFLLIPQRKILVRRWRHTNFMACGWNFVFEQRPSKSHLVGKLACGSLP